MTSTLITFRDTLRQISPRWLNRTKWGALLYSIGVHADAIGDAATQAVGRRFPGLTGYGDEIELLGAERKISRGRIETDETYTTRLRSWLDVHRIRGGPYAMLEQARAFTAPLLVGFDLVYATGRRFSLPANATTITRDRIPWIDPSPQMFRWWLIVESPLLINSDGNWDDPGSWDDDGLWNFNLPRSDAESYLTIPNDMNAAHSLGYLCVLPPGTGVLDYPRTIWDDQNALGTAGIIRLQVH